MLTIQQIDQIFQIFRRNNILFICKNLGADYLTEEELELLRSYNIDPFEYYDLKGDMVESSFYFGLISDVLKKDAKKISFEELKEHVESGDYIPLTEVERNTISSVKKQFLGDIRSHQGRIFNDINNIIAENEKDNREAYEKVIRDEIERGLLEKKTRSEIARDLARKTGDWNRDFTKAVEFISHLALSEGRAALVERKNGGEGKVWVQVYKGACKHCIKHYLTNGEDSKPKIFPLSELKANGTNIGRKVDEWKAVIPPMHVFCRCNIEEFIDGAKWSEGDKGFTEFEEKEEGEMKRKPIRVTFGEKTYSV